MTRGPLVDERDGLELEVAERKAHYRQRRNNGSVKIFSSGSALNGGPSLYLQSPLHHGHSSHFREIAGFEPFDGSVGTRVATTSTTTGANL
jgi:hypothetical protein